METQRLPLVGPIETRDSTLSKDADVVNLYAESTPIGPMLVKRPGYTLNSDISGSVAQGAVRFITSVYAVVDNTLQLVSGV